VRTRARLWVSGNENPRSNDADAQASIQPAAADNASGGSPIAHPFGAAGAVSHEVASVDALRRRLHEPRAPLVGHAGNVCGALYVAPGDRQIGDEAKDDDRQRQRDASGA
jgi:hypothetical protein